MPILTEQPRFALASIRARLWRCLMNRNPAIIVVLVVLALPFSRAAAQCSLSWSDQFQSPWPNGSIESAVNFDDDGNGPNPPALIIAGHFTVAGGVPVNNI